MLSNRYEIRGLMGSGGMGAVFRAHDRVLESEVALKVIRPELAKDERQRERFVNEVKLARSITHPNVCRLYDIVEAEGVWFFTMEYVDGDPLDKWLGRLKPAPFAWIVEVLRDVCRGVGAAHDKGVIHRDLKPPNVLIAGDGRAIVLDFGIARQTGTGRLTQDGRRIGTGIYMSPEQLFGDEGDARSDVFAIGVLAMEMLTGDPKRTASDSARPNMPKELLQFIECCLEEEPAHRFANASRALRALDRIAEGLDAEDEEDEAPASPLATTKEEVSPKPPTRPARRRWPIAVAALGLAAAVGTGILWLAQDRDSALDDGDDRVVGPRPMIVFEPFSGSDLPGGDGWLELGLPRLVAEEMGDAWLIDAALITDDAPATATVVTGTIERDLAGRYEANFEIRAGSESTHHKAARAAPRALAEEVARIVIETSVAPSWHGPSSTELTAHGATDKQAWRLWRRARRAGLMQATDRARDLSRRAIELDPEFPLPYLEIAATHEVGDREGFEAINTAAKLGEKLGSRWTDEIDAYYQYFHGNDLAIYGIVPRVLQQAPDDVAAHYRHAEMLIESGKLDEGLGRMKALTDKFPRDAAAFKFLAQYYIGAAGPFSQPRSTAEGLTNAKRAVRLAPDDSGARAVLALALLQVGDDAGAAPHIALAEKWAPSDPTVVTASFTLAFAQGKPTVAKDAARRLLVGDPMLHANGLYLLALVDLWRGHFDVGLDRLDTAAQRLEGGSSGQAAAVQADRGWYALQLGNTKVARKAFAEAKRLHPRVFGLIEGHTVFDALVAPTKDKLARATGLLVERRQSGYPDEKIYALHLEIAMARADGRWKDVLDRYEKLSADDVAQLWAQYDAAQAHENLGNPDRAIEIYRRLADNPLAWAEPILAVKAQARLGALYTAKGDAEGAQAAYAVVVERWGTANPDVQELRDARRQR